METKMIKEDRKIEVFVEREDTGSNRDLKLSLKIGNNTTSFPCLTEGELTKLKNSLDEYFKFKRKIVTTIEDVRREEKSCFYRIKKIDKYDAYGLGGVSISSDAIFKHEPTLLDDRVVKGYVLHSNGRLSEEVYFHDNTIVEILSEEEVKELVLK